MNLLTKFIFIFFNQAFHNEMKCIFQNRLITEEHKDQFVRILQSTTRTLFQIDQTQQFFVPTGSQSTALQSVSQQDWTDIINRNITICSEFNNTI